MTDAEAAIANAQKLADQFAQGPEGAGTEVPLTENGDSQNNKRKLEDDGDNEEDGMRKKASFNGAQAELVGVLLVVFRVHYIPRWYFCLFLLVSVAYELFAWKHSSSPVGRIRKDQAMLTESIQPFIPNRCSLVTNLRV